MVAAVTEPLPPPPKPEWQLTRLRCGADLCGTEWQDWQASGVKMEVFVACMRSFRCPRCGSRKRVYLVSR